MHVCSLNKSYASWETAKFDTFLRTFQRRYFCQWHCHTGMSEWLSRVLRPSQHIIGHSRDESFPWGSHTNILNERLTVGCCPVNHKNTMSFWNTNKTCCRDLRIIMTSDLSIESYTDTNLSPFLPVPAKINSSYHCLHRCQPTLNEYRLYRTITVG